MVYVVQYEKDGEKKERRIDPTRPPKHIMGTVKWAIAKFLDIDATAIRAYWVAPGRASGR